jgi:hypothetical protein
MCHSGFLRKIQKMHFSQKIVETKKTTINGTSESAPQELFNEWSCQ